MKKYIEYDFYAISGGVNIIEIKPDTFGLNLYFEYEFEDPLFPKSIHVPFENLYNKKLLMEAERIIERVYHKNINNLLTKIIEK
jgi:hypothetical protein